MVKSAIRGFSYASFDSKLVRLKGDLNERPELVLVSFDSKLVRLKAFGLTFNRNVKTVFRFQTGSIKSGLVLDISHFLPPCFDSKLVRLKGSIGSIKSAATSWFRFQTGSIKSLHNNKRFKLGNSFDSKLVRLKVSAIPIESRSRAQFRFQTGSIKSQIVLLIWTGTEVSIPNWFD